MLDKYNSVKNTFSNLISLSFTFINTSSNGVDESERKSNHIGRCAFDAQC